MHFSRLRLSGFKSFVEPTELHIEPGLTGVVGPNGCGKSNLLEAIRWVMGENRAKSLRGAGMDDVIFAGTGKRPARNLAEVTLVLDNFEKTAPAGYNDHDVIEVTRRIERDSGSSYRINGKDVRQKDVQLLFADAATGAHSPALVSQGRIGALINAKPQERRAILEEAAGISGLHQRRKEAESRLKGAEGNLTRLQDVVGQMETQINSLKRQAKQAQRYRSIAGDVRQAEASLLYIKWITASEEVIELERRLREADKVVQDFTGRVSALSKEQVITAAELPDLRNKDAEASAALQRLNIEKENLDAEQRRREDTMVNLSARIEQIEVDKEREQEIANDAKDASERLSKEKIRLESDKDSEKEAEQLAKETLDSAIKLAGTAEAEFDKLNEQAAQARARKSSLESDLLAINRRLERLEADDKRLKLELEQLEASDKTAAGVKEAEKAVTVGEKVRNDAGDAVEKAELEASKAREALSTAQAEQATADSAFNTLSSEVKSLQDLLDGGNSNNITPVSEGIKARAGYEVAVGAVFGEDIDASTDDQESRFWTALSNYDGACDWPKGITALGDFVEVPAELMRRCALTGFIEEGVNKGIELAEHLKAGQRIVDVEGNMWRWDGFVKKAGAASRAALRLEHRNRLVELEGQLIEAEENSVSIAEKVLTTDAAFNEAKTVETLARESRAESERSLQVARRAFVAAEHEASRRATRSTGIKEAMERLKLENKDNKERHKGIADKIGELPNIDGLESTLREQRAGVEKLRAALSEARTRYDSLHRETVARADRLMSITTELQSWMMRVSSADKQLKELSERSLDAGKQLDALKAGPADMASKRDNLLSALARADKARKESSDALVAAEAKLAEKDAALKDGTSKQAEAREIQIRLDAAVENGVDRRKSIASTIGERFECAPTHVLEKVGVETSDNLPDLATLEETLERLKRERDRLGAVNLRAEEELKEIDEQLGHMVGERRDLEEAIARLRSAINDLNKEGRERLLVAFDQVNAHFGELFVTLFGGGEAHLKLTESDDPLDAGLEIFASPPGKRLQALSLLSGGEQALTALSLIFAVFVTNPAPICVLDEVDAPLDDANVERYCNLLDDMIARTNTRFLIVTHNAVSMSRVNRLFGVTMAERGISSLVSVDLERAEDFLEAGQ